MGRLRVLRFERLPPPPAPGRPSPLLGLRACPGALFLFLGCIPEPGSPHHALRPLPQDAEMEQMCPGQGGRWKLGPPTGVTPGSLDRLPRCHLSWFGHTPDHYMCSSCHLTTPGSQQLPSACGLAQGGAPEVRVHLPQPSPATAQHGW